MTTKKTAPALLIETHMLNQAAQCFRAVNNPLRQKILQVLHRQTSMTVQQLYRRLQLEQSIASFHLAILRRAGLVQPKREGKHVYYSVNYTQVERIHHYARLLLGE